MKSIEPVIVMGVCLVVLSCASSGSSSRAGDGSESPRMLSRGAPPDLRFPGRTGNVRIDIEVEVDESGRADVGTLKVSGAGAADNRQAIQQWLQQALFDPARFEGVPMRGVFKMQIQAGTTVRRSGGG